MARYRPVPSSWYALLFLLTIGMSIAAISASPTELPVWALFVATGVAGVLVLPVGLIQAMTNWGVGINVVVRQCIHRDGALMRDRRR